MELGRCPGTGWSNDSKECHAEVSDVLAHPPGRAWTPAMSTTTSSLRELSVAECWELLGNHSIGRVAWKAADGLQLLPVSYAVYREAIVFRTSPYGLLSELVRPSEVIFEVDELDRRARAGWSVLVRGRARSVAAPNELMELGTLDSLSPWAAGVRTLFIEITPRLLTGRAMPGPLP